MLTAGNGVSHIGRSFQLSVGVAFGARVVHPVCTLYVEYGESKSRRRKPLSSAVQDKLSFDCLEWSVLFRHFPFATSYVGPTCFGVQKLVGRLLLFSTKRRAMPYCGIQPVTISANKLMQTSLHCRSSWRILHIHSFSYSHLFRPSPHAISIPSCSIISTLPLLALRQL